MDFRTADTGAREEGEGLVGDGSRPREARGKHHAFRLTRVKEAAPSSNELDLGRNCR